MTNGRALRIVIKKLVDNGVLSKKDNDKQLKSPKLSKLIEIGENDYLQRKDVRPLLPPSYSTLYEICLLAYDLERKFPKVAEERLVKFLELHRGDLSTDLLLRERKKHKPKPSQRKPTKRESDSPSSSIAKLVAEAKSFDLVLVTPSPRDIDVLKDDYSDGYLAQCFPLAGLVTARDEPSVVALAIEAKWLRVAPKILSLAGRRDADQFLLMEKPKSPDISGNKLLLLSPAGGERSSLKKRSSKWPEDPSDLLSSIQKLYPSLRRRLHVFGSEMRQGWLSLVGDQNWISLPKVRT